MKKILPLLILILPTFSLMFRPGIHSMHDFHPFRLYEFVRCGAFPCRWAADAGAGYGEPVFVYYGQFVYWLGALFHLVNFSILASTKLVFITAFILSAYFMFLLSKRYFGNLGGFISALFYTYAPYRAIDTWVRGALPEAFSFVLFPAILIAPNIFWQSIAIATLIITHNLSALMFLPFAFIFSLFLKQTKKILISSLIAFFLSAFYLVPLYWENNLVSLNKFTQDLYQYQIHYTTLNQLFLSRFWGYGSSVWGTNDNLSFSVGHLHWLLGLLVVGLAIYKKNKIALLGGILGFVAVFFTHGKSELIWKIFSPLAFLQFPWRFLSISTFFLSFAVGYIRKFTPYLLLLLLSLNVNFFKPDYWISQTDNQYFSGDFWTTQRFASLLDYWPKNAALPNEIAPSEPWFSLGFGQINQLVKYKYRVISDTESVVTFPLVNFAGWKAFVNDKPAPIINYSDLKLISIQVPIGESVVDLKFTNTPDRQIGNLISLTALIIVIANLSRSKVKQSRHEKNILA